MGVITVKVDDEVEERFRKKIAEVHGLARGSLSKAVGEAMRLWIEASSHARRESGVVFSAYQGRKRVAQAASLKVLAQTLRERGVDPREVSIRSSSPTRKVERLGLRVSG